MGKKSKSVARKLEMKEEKQKKKVVISESSEDSEVSSASEDTSKSTSTSGESSSSGDSSSSDDSSDTSSSNGSSGDDSSDDDSKSSEEKKSSSSDDSSDEDDTKSSSSDDSSDDDDTKSSSSDDSSDDDDDSSEGKKVSSSESDKAKSPSSSGESSDSEADSDSSSSEDSDNSDSSADEEEEEKEEPVSKKGTKRKAEESEPAQKKAKVDVSLANGSRTVFMRNLPWSATEDDLRSYLADAGPIYEVRIAVDYDGRPKGFAHVQFESEEGAAAAIQMSGGYVGDREVHIETTTERQQRTPQQDNGSTLFVKGFDKYLGEEEVRRQLSEAFGEYGQVNGVRLPSDRETGELKGIGYVEFASVEEKNAAAELDGQEAAGGWLKVDLNPGTPSSGGRGGRDGGRFGGRGGRDGGRFGGRGGRDSGRGRGGRGPQKPRLSIDANASGTGMNKKMTFD